MGHQGNAYGSICGMFVDPEEHTGFVFLTSGAFMGKDEAGIYYVNRDIGRAVYEAFFDAGMIEVVPAENSGMELVEPAVSDPGIQAEAEAKYNDANEPA